MVAASSVKIAELRVFHRTEVDAECLGCRVISGQSLPENSYGFREFSFAKFQFFSFEPVLSEFLQVVLAARALFAVCHFESFPEIANILLSLGIHLLDRGYFLLYSLCMMLCQQCDPFWGLVNRHPNQYQQDQQIVPPFYTNKNISIKAFFLIVTLQKIWPMRFVKLRVRIIIMGICTKGKEKEDSNVISTKAIFKTASFEKMQFYFTTENLLRIDADCLVIYCDEKMNLHKNTFISKIGKFQTRKIKEFAQTHLLTSKARLLPGQIIFFPISISTLQFKFVGMVCLKPWDGHEAIEPKMQPILNQLFNDLNRHHVQSLAITQFNEQFGIPTQIACKLISEALYSGKDWLKIVTVICNNISTQNFYMQKIVDYTPDGSEINKTLEMSASIYY